MFALGTPPAAPVDRGRFFLRSSCTKREPLSSSLIMSNFHQTHQSISSSPANQSVAAIIFGEGSESQLCPLTRRRSTGAIPIAANYRLIDVVVSNCINSNITKIYALTQFNSTSLNSHLVRAYSTSGPGKQGFVEVIAACQSPENQSWFQGNADAVRRCLWVMEEHPVTEFLILPCHHLYRMDYQKLLKAHRKSKADITISALSSMGGEDQGFGVLKVDSKNQVLKLMESRREPKLHIENSGQSEGNGCNTFASMGIYVINKNVMTHILKECLPGANEVTSEVIPGAISLGMKVHAYLFDGPWENMTSIRAFYEANIECTKKSKARFDFYNTVSPMYTLPRHLPPTKVTQAIITDSVIGDGCILGRCRIKGTVVGLRTRIGDEAVIEDSVIMGSDFYQEDVEDSTMDGKKRVIPIGIGDGSLIKNAIIDKNARIGSQVKIINNDNVQEGGRDAQGFVISDGIIVVIRNAIIPNGRIL